MSPQNMPICHEGYFELKAIENQRMKEKLFTFICLKIEYKFPLLENKFTFEKEIFVCKGVSYLGESYTLRQLLSPEKLLSA